MYMICIPLQSQLPQPYEERNHFDGGGGGEQKKEEEEKNNSFDLQAKISSALFSV